MHAVEGDFELRLLHFAARSAVMEIIDGGRYDTLCPYRIRVGEKEPFETERTVNCLFDLTPDCDVTVRVTRKETGEEKTITFHTLYESVSLNVRDFGARGDGFSDDTPALQAAIAACPKDGRVVVPAGVYQFTCLWLKSFLHLTLEKNAVLRAFTDESRLPVLPGEITYYDETDEYQLGMWEGNPLPSHPGLISALNAEHILLEGEGVIDGAASYENWWRKERVKALPARPRLLFLSRCEDVTVVGLTFENSPAWTIHPWFCERVSFFGTEVFNPKVSPNTDGIDPESCTDVLLAGMHFSLGDDCIAVKSGKIYMAGRRHTPSRHITVRQCLLENGHGAVTLGSEIASGVYDVTVEDCVFRKTDRGLRIKTRRGRGAEAVIDGVVFRGIEMDEVRTPFVINCFYYCDPDGHTSYVSAREALPVDERTPRIGRVLFEHIHCTNAHVAAAHIEGLPEQKIEEVVFRDVTIRMSGNPVRGLPAMAEGVEERCAGGMFIRNAEHLILENVKVEGTAGKAFDFDEIGRIDAEDGAGAGPGEVTT